MSKRKIKVKVLALIQHRGQILVSEGFDKKKNETFYRPLGGKVEFGETVNEALVREMMEEISAKIKIKKQVCILESLFTFNGKSGHEYVYVLSADFVSQALYQKKTFKVIEKKQTRRAMWIPLESFLSKEKILYPNGLLEFLE